jgi:hypothetical protein
LVDHDLRFEIGVRAFEKRLQEIKDPRSVEGFLLAVKDSYLAKIPGAQETDPVPAMIARTLATEGAKAA